MPRRKFTEEERLESRRKRLEKLREYSKRLRENEEYKSAEAASKREYRKRKSCQRHENDMKRFKSTKCIATKPATEDCKENDKDVIMEDTSSSKTENATKEKDAKMEAVPSAQIGYNAEKTDVKKESPVSSTECKIQESGADPLSGSTDKLENCKVSEEGKKDSSTEISDVKIKEEDVIMEEPAIVKPECSKEAAACLKENVESNEIKASVQEAVSSKEEAECSRVPQRVRLSIEDDEEDDGEEYVVMTPEEVRNFLLLKVNQYMKDPEKNPILNLKQQALRLEAEIRRKNEEFERLSRLFEHIYHDQEKFLRHIGLLAKIPALDFGAQVDMPPLPTALSTIPRECLSKMKGAVAKADANLPQLAPSRSKNLSTAPALRPVGPPPKPVAPPPKPVVPPPKPVVPPPKPAQGNKEIECIDLTDDSDTPSTSNSTPAPATAVSPKFKSPVPASSSTVSAPLRHPAPLPDWPVETHNKTSDPPPKPRLKISAEKQGIILQWDMTLNSNQAKISSYEIYGYQELKQMPISSSLWVKIGLVQAMSLPMACTLTQFQEGHTYHFSLRAVDVNGRCGVFSDPATIVFSPQTALKITKT